MITHHPMAQHRKPGRTKRYLTAAGEAVAVLLVVAAVVLALEALSHTSTGHRMPERSAGISEPRTAWPELISEAVTAGAERIHAR